MKRDNPDKYLKYAEWREPRIAVVGYNGLTTAVVKGRIHLNQRALARAQRFPVDATNDYYVIFKAPFRSTSYTESTGWTWCIPNKNGTVSSLDVSRFATQTSLMHRIPPKGEDFYDPMGWRFRPDELYPPPSWDWIIEQARQRLDQLCATLEAHMRFWATHGRNADFAVSIEEVVRLYGTKPEPKAGPLIGSDPASFE